MLNPEKLDNLIKDNDKTVADLAASLRRTGLSQKQAASAIKNWRAGLMKPQPKRADVEKLAEAFGVEPVDLSQWACVVKYAPTSPRKARLVTQLIAGRSVQDALDLLKFTRKRAADMVNKALQSAVANADEDAADVENLYVCQARVDGAGVRVGTKRWIAKDRGRAHSIRKQASHIHVVVAEI